MSGISRVSVMLYPDESVAELLATAATAEEAGLDTVYFTDSTVRKDLWTLLAATAMRTSRIRLGPSAIRVLWRDPLLSAQALATLDELSDGRVDAVIGAGSPPPFRPGQASDRPARPAAIVREALAVMRAALDSGSIEYEGEAFRYRYSHATRLSARPRQAHLPLAVGTMGGPRSMTMAGAVADGMHVAPACTPVAAAYCIEHVRRGASDAGRDWRLLDIALAPVVVCADDEDAAHEVARVRAAFYLPKLAPPFLEAQGIAHDDVAPIEQAWQRGDVAGAVRLATPRLVETVAVAGRPEHCAERLAALGASGVRHIVLMLADPFHAGLLTGKLVAGVPSVREQLQLVAERMLPLVRTAADASVPESRDVRAAAAPARSGLDG